LLLLPYIITIYYYIKRYIKLRTIVKATIGYYRLLLLIVEIITTLDRLRYN